MGFLTDEDKKAIRNGIGRTPLERQAEAEQQSWGDFGLGFVNSAVQSPGELFGFDAGPQAQEFRTMNPMAGLMSELVGGAVPYLGWAKASKSIRPLERVISGSDMALEGRPILAGAAREVIRYAPLEAGGILSTALVNPDDTGERMFQGLVNLGVGGILGGFYHGGRAGGFGEEPLGNLPGIPHRAPYTLRLRALRENAEKGLYPTENPETLNRQARIYEAQLLSEIPQAGDRYLRVGGKPGTVGAAMDSLFHPGDSRSGRTMFLNNDEKLGWSTNARAQELMKKEFGDRGLEYVQFPRLHAAYDETTERLIQRTMRPAEGDTWYVQDGPDGLFTMARKIRMASPTPTAGTELVIPKETIGATADVRLGADGRLGRVPPKNFEGKAKDYWLMWKTDQPGRFVKQGENWRQAATKAWSPIQMPKWAPDSPGALMQEHLDEIFLLTKLADETPQKREHLLSKMLNKRGLTKEGLSARKQIAAFVRRYVSPADHQYSGRAAAVWSVMDAGKDAARALASKLTRGGYEVGANPAKDLWQMKGFGNRPATDTGGTMAGLTPTNQIWDGVTDPKALNDVHQALRNQEDIASVRKDWLEGNVHDQAYKALEQSQQVDDFLMGQLNDALRKADLPEVTPLPGHYMLSRGWKGDVRMPLHDKEGRIVYMIGDHSLGAVQAQQKAYGDIPEGWHWGDSFKKGETPDLIHALKVDVEGNGFRLARNLGRKPLSLRDRAGVGGYEGHQAPLTAKELKEISGRHVQDMANYAYEVSAKRVLERELSDLFLEDPNAFKSLMERFETMQGRPGGFSKWQNEKADQALGNILGANSATKIARAANSLGFSLQLGMGNLSHPALTLIGTFQQLLPQIAFVTKAPEETLRKFYTMVPLGGAVEGSLRGSVGMLDPFKLMRQGFREMRNPGENVRAAIKEAADRGKLFANLEQELLGPDSTMGQGIKKAWEDGGLVGGMKYLSDFLPRKAEDQARLLALTTGVKVAEDVLRLTDQKQIVRFATEFLDRTMYNYANYARSQIFQGPMGSMFGLFKNWTMNYMHWMGEYAGLAMKGEMAPLMWMLGSTGAIAGLGGTAISGLADPFVKMATGKGVFENIHSMFDPEDQMYADGIYHGLPGLFGYTLQASAGMPGADPARDASMLYNFALLDRAKALGSAVGGAIDNLGVTGAHPAADPQVRDQLIKAFAPRSIQRAMQMRGDGYVTSMTTGQPIAKLRGVEQAAYLMGFTPRQVADNYQIANILFSEKEKRKSALAAYAKMYIEAQNEGDGQAMGATVRMALTQGLSYDSLIRSVKMRRERATKDIVEFRMPKEDRGRRFQRTEPEEEPEL